jgi:hypothetical protein
LTHPHPIEIRVQSEMRIDGNGRKSEIKSLAGRRSVEEMIGKPLSNNKPSSGKRNAEKQSPPGGEAVHGTGGVASRAFDPETVKLIACAYETAWREIEAAGKPVSLATRNETSTALTQHLLAAAEAGERDPAKLKLLALEAMGLK